MTDYPLIKTAGELIEALGLLPPDTPLVGECADREGVKIIPQEPSGSALICSPDEPREASVSP